MILKKIQLFFVLLMLLPLNACQQQQSKTKLPPANVQVVKITKTQIPVFKDYIGTTQSVAKVNIRARVQGFLTEKNFTEGGRVKRGQLLFVIDPKPYQAQLDLAQANLQKSIAEVAFQKVQFQRFTELVKKQAAAQERLDQVSTDLQKAQAEVLVQQANVEQAQINLSYCYMYSPIAGKIGEKYVDVGNLVSGAKETLLATVVQLDPIYVQFSPSINDFGEIIRFWDNRPFKVIITIPGYKLSFNGQIDLVNNKADQTTSTVLMRAVVQNPEKILLPGVYVNVRMILAAKQQVITVPNTAIMETQGQNYVYTVDKNNKVKLQTIVIAYQYKNSEVVESGLQPGDLVIVQGLQYVQPGGTVKTELLTPKQPP